MNDVTQMVMFEEGRSKGHLKIPSVFGRYSHA